MDIKQIRESAGFTQVQVAEKAELSERGYQAIEAGTRKPRIDTAQRIARALGKSVDELFPMESV